MDEALQLSLAMSTSLNEDLINQLPTDTKIDAACAPCSDTGMNPMNAFHKRLTPKPDPKKIVKKRGKVKHK